MPDSFDYEGSFPPPNMEVLALNPYNYKWSKKSFGGFSASTSCAGFLSLGWGPDTTDMRFNTGMSNIDSGLLSFDVAYAKVTGNTDYDTLEVLVSTDCGETFSSVYKKGGQDLATMADIPGINVFNPGASDWRKDTISLKSYYQTPNIVIAFRAHSPIQQQEIICVDNININGTVVIPPNKINTFTEVEELTIIPNPNTGQFTVSLPYMTQNLKLSITDIVGNEIKAETIIHNSNNVINVEMGNRPAGIYFLNCYIQGKKFVGKIVLTK
jgi:hypothetical protein